MAPHLLTTYGGYFPFEKDLPHKVVYRDIYFFVQNVSAIHFKLPPNHDKLKSCKFGRTELRIPYHMEKIETL